MFISYSAAFDGKAYPVAGPRNGDSIALTKEDAHTVMTIVRHRTSVTSLSRWVVSNDGKHINVTRKSGSPRGKLVVSTLIYDKK